MKDKGKIVFLARLRQGDFSTLETWKWRQSRAWGADSVPQVLTWISKNPGSIWLRLLLGKSSAQCP